MFIIFAVDLQAETVNPFMSLPAGAAADKAVSAAFSKAEKLYAWFAGETRGGEFNIQGLQQEILNPFVSKASEEPAVAELEKGPALHVLSRLEQHHVPDGPLPVDGEKSKTVPEFKLMGYVWGTQRPQAILNGMIVDVGDKVDGWIVLDISKRGILLESHDKKRHFIEP